MKSSIHRTDNENNYKLEQVWDRIWKDEYNIINTKFNDVLLILIF